MAGTLDGKVAVIAGAGEGIGRATALALARAGADVVVAARRPEPLEKLAAEIAADSGREVVAMPTDIVDPEACHTLAAAASDLLGRLDIVVNVATFNPPGAIEDIDRDEFRRAFDVNVLGVLEVSRAALPYMRRVGGGSIVQISSAAPRMKLPGLGAYAATKAAMEIASATMAREVGRDGIRVNVVVAGYTDNAKLTAYIDEIAAEQGSTPEAVRAGMASSAALRRITRTEDIAETVLFLSGPGAAGITGTVTQVTSGILLEP